MNNDRTYDNVDLFNKNGEKLGQNDIISDLTCKIDRQSSKNLTRGSKKVK